MRPRLARRDPHPVEGRDLNEQEDPVLMVAVVIAWAVVVGVVSHGIVNWILDE